MKILIIPEYLNFGGTLTFLKRLLVIHKKNAIETSVLIQKNQQQNEIMRYFNEMNIKVYTGVNRGKLFGPSFSMLYDIFFCLRTYKIFQPDLIVVSNGHPGYMSGILLFPAPVVFFMHSYPRPNFHIFLRFLWGILTRLNNHILTVSEYSRQQIRRYMLVPKCKIDVVYNSFKPVNINTDNVSKQRIVLTIGHIVGYKNPDVWLDVAQKVIKKVPEVKFIWLGDGKLLAAMRYRVKSLGFEDHIHFKGYCDNVDRYYKKSMIYFQPSLIESHGISIIDAMSHGMPCICSNIGGIPESVVDGHSGYLLDPNDVEGFVEKINSLLQSPDLCRKFGNNGKVIAEKKFGAEVQENMIIDQYRKLLMLK